MSHIGIVCPPVTGHLKPMFLLGQKLEARGHQVTVFQIPDIRSKVNTAGLSFHAIGTTDFPVGSSKKYFEELSQYRGIQELKFTLKAGNRLTHMICRDLPGAIAKCNIDLLLVDQNEPAGGSVAEFLKIPFITICSSLAINRERLIPPVFTPWSYHQNFFAGFRNQIGYRVFDLIIHSINKTLNGFRYQWGLNPIQTPEDTFSKIAQISQQPPEFDFPRRKRPLGFHYVGPFQRSNVKLHEQSKRNSTRPLIYASLGTLHNRKPELFQTIAKACETLNADLVISLGGGPKTLEYDGLPGSPKVVEYLTRDELENIFSQANLIITHAGFNTVLESLSFGVPMVAIPMTMDQPATGARINWTKTGKTIALNKLSVKRLQTCARDTLSNSSYRENAKRIGESIHSLGGICDAVLIIETALESRSLNHPVLSIHS